jgi:hypothetical protein
MATEPDVNGVFTAFAVRSLHLQIIRQTVIPDLAKPDGSR